MLDDLKIICEKCGEEYYKYQPLKFTIILLSSYIKCPYCGKRKYLNFK